MTVKEAIENKISQLTKERWETMKIDTGSQGFWDKLFLLELELKKYKRMLKDEEQE